jgi:hypothetical protein
MRRLTNANSSYAHRPAAVAAADPQDPPEAPPPLPCLAWGPLDKQQQQQYSGSPRAATATAAACPRALLARGWGRCVQLVSVTLEPAAAATTGTADSTAASGTAAAAAATRTPTAAAAAAAAALQGPTMRLEVTRRIETDGRVLAVEWLSSTALACVVQHCELRVYDMRSGSELERCSLAPLTLVRTPLATATAGADSTYASTSVKRTPTTVGAATAATAGSSSAAAGEHKAAMSAERSSSDASTTSTAATTATAGADADTDTADGDSSTATTVTAAAGDADTSTTTAVHVAAPIAAAVPAAAQFSYANCIRAVDGRLYTLGTSRLRVARVQDWQQRVSGCIAAGEWLEALAVALDHYEESSAAVRAARQPGKLRLLL